MTGVDLVRGFESLPLRWATAEARDGGLDPGSPSGRLGGVADRPDDVQIDADTAQDTMRTIAEHDSGAARLGEVALVDREGRIGKLDTVFYDTLLDENAASHIALGHGFGFLAPDTPERVNESTIHLDFMIGSPEMRITGITRSGERVPVLIEGHWQIF